MSGAEASLTFLDGREFALDGSVSVGRDDANHLVLDSPTVSRRHAVVSFRNERWWIEDVGSFNGTFLNGVRLQPGTAMPLRHTDRIEIGSQSFVFSWPSQLLDPDATQAVEASEAGGATLSPFQTQVVRLLCEPWVAGASLEQLPSNDEIAHRLGTPGAAGAVKAALSRVYAKAGLTNEPAQTKRRALCRVARQRGWI